MAAGNAQQTLSAENYQRTVDDQQRALRYVPGKYAFNVLVQLQSAVRRKFVAAPSEGIAADSWERHATLFIEVLRRSPVDLSRIPLTVLSQHSEDLALQIELQNPVVPAVGHEQVSVGRECQAPG